MRDVIGRHMVHLGNALIVSEKKRIIIAARRREKLMSDWKHITLFDRPYPADKQAEAIAIHLAVVEGHCEKCGSLPQCSTQSDFQFPPFSWCMIKKAEILRGLSRPPESKP